MASGEGPVRPVDLIGAVNAKSEDGQLSWKVMEDRLRRLEASGYIGRREVPHGPRESRYWLFPPGHQLLGARRLDTWFGEQEPGATATPLLPSAKSQADSVSLLSLAG